MPTSPASSRGRDAAPDHGAPIDDDSLVETTHPLSSYPAFPGKQWVLGVAAAIYAIAMFVPWWDAEIPLDRVADTLNGWLLLGAGFSIGSLGVNTSYNWFGNVLFGVVPVLPMLVLAVLLVLRVLRVLVTPANVLFLWCLITAGGSLWLLVFASMRIDAANGGYPAMAAPWIVLVVSLGLGVMCVAWWRTERQHFPKRRWMGFGPTQRRADDAAVRAEADHLFDGIEDNDDAEDAPLSLDGGVDTDPPERAGR